MVGGDISGLSGHTAFFLGQARHSIAWEEAYDARSGDVGATHNKIKIMVKLSTL